MKNNGYFIISLDFELFWGVHDVFSFEQYGQNIRNVNTVIPRLLDLFKKYDIQATFGVVGGIYHANYKDFVDFHSSSTLFPKYLNDSLSPYEGKGLKMIKTYPELFFNPELIDEVRNSGMEIASHTYCHYYCGEEGVDVSSFDYDISKAKQIANEHGDNIESIIFPRNQIIPESFKKVLIKYGIKCYRCNPYNCYNGSKLSSRIKRLASSYLPITQTVFDKPIKDKIIKIPASLFLRPYTKLTIFNKFQLLNIKHSMHKAAKEGKMFHLWWHPHNFGVNTKENLDMLENILIYYKELNKELGYKSISMLSYSNLSIR